MVYMHSRVYNYFKGLFLSRLKLTVIDFCFVFLWRNDGTSSLLLLTREESFSCQFCKLDDVLFILQVCYWQKMDCRMFQHQTSEITSTT